MTISVFDLFTIGIGPSSSHTVGPMRAAAAFVADLSARHQLEAVQDIRVELHGSLAATGRGHGTPGAVLLGLEGELPDRIDPGAGAARLQQITASGTLRLGGTYEVPWSNDRMIWSPHDRSLQHPNAVTFTAYTAPGGDSIRDRWYSVGGGFIRRHGDHRTPGASASVPFPFATTAQLLTYCASEQATIGDIARHNERALHSPDEIRDRLQLVRETMDATIERGLRATGVLPGGLNVPRRAADLYRRAHEDDGRPSLTDRLGIFAMAVNEENAAGGRVVTAPTNGAAGVIPAVLRVALEEHCAEGDGRVVAETFLLTAGAIGSIITQRASISGAEVGCQGEVGSACAMAAAGLTAVRGGTAQQIENAAEIAIEHHLGMTCDPIGGLVQIPCIERNGMAAVKAVYASRIALLGNGTHRITLDQVIETMRQTGADMNTKYKETSTGGLAVNAVDC
ncbi:L-serine ammonia-lyase [Tsukamurella soli]|uniref:L-serine dehydratase n=1 Tax=Tsukamurella soli TaxID=644556 RepID=A0ABP8K923_9ACTN